MTPGDVLVNLASKVDSRLIRRSGLPYLWRSYLAPEDDEVGAFLHRFVSDDAHDELHSHPFEWSVSFILEGSYKEYRAVGDAVPGGGPLVRLRDRSTRVFGPGLKNQILHDTFHRVELVTDEVWTLFIHGPRINTWGFVPDSMADRPLPLRVVSGKTRDKLPLEKMAP